MNKSRVRIGEVAKGAAVSVGTIRYYEKRKLLPLSPRSEAGYRLFSVEAIERVRFIKQAQEVGLSLDEITTLLSGGGAVACGEMRNLLETKVEEINRRLRDSAHSPARLTVICKHARRN